MTSLIVLLSTERLYLKNYRTVEVTLNMLQLNIWIVLTSSLKNGSTGIFVVFVTCEGHKTHFLKFAKNICPYFCLIHNVHVFC